MGEKKDGSRYYQPKPNLVKAVQWIQGTKHPLIKDSCDCGKGCELCVAKVPVLVNRGGRAPIASGDYIIGPDDQGLVHVFNQKEFESQFELARAAATLSITAEARQARWLSSTFARNSVLDVIHWFRMNKDSAWARSNPGAGQAMYEHEKFLQQHFEAMERHARGE